jgi:hypothetical protein
MIGPLTTAPGGFTHVLVAIDNFTQWIEYKPIATLSAHRGVTFICDILHRFGFRNVAEPPELFRFKCTNHCHKGKMISNAPQTEQPMGLSGHRLMQPRFHRIEVGYTHTR